MLILIDNYDSFTYNLVHYFEEIGQKVKVLRNDQSSSDEVLKLKPQYLVISPGLVLKKFRICLELIKRILTQKYYSVVRSLSWPPSNS